MVSGGKADEGLLPMGGTTSVLTAFAAGLSSVLSGADTYCLFTEDLAYGATDLILGGLRSYLEYVGVGLLLVGSGGLSEANALNNVKSIHG
jgi:hypothetical protein